MPDLNAGFASRSVLLAALLAEELRADATWAPPILQVGLGVAAAFQRHCNRRFERVVGAVDEYRDAIYHCVLERYPVESVAKIETQARHGAEWIEQDLAIQDIDPAAGVLYLSSSLDSSGRIRVTYTGGYWWDITDAATGTLPAGATALPADLLHAWLQQCRAVWARVPKLGVPVATLTKDLTAFQPLEPDVAATLATYRRYQLT